MLMGALGAILYLCAIAVLVWEILRANKAA